jgi:hypothetical protein
MITAEERLALFLTKYKGIKWDEIKVIREEKYDVPLTTVDGTWQVDIDSRTSIDYGILSLTNDTDTIEWRALDNTMPALNRLQLKNILLEYATRRVSIFDSVFAVKDIIDNVTTSEEMDALDLESLVDANL